MAVPKKAIIEAIETLGASSLDDIKHAWAEISDGEFKPRSDIKAVATLVGYAFAGAMLVATFFESHDAADTTEDIRAEIAEIRGMVEGN